MGYDYNFINRTKKHVVSHKFLSQGFENQKYLCEYLSYCLGDTIDIVSDNVLEDLDLSEYKHKSWWIYNQEFEGVEFNEFLDI